jgi:hypothetical protein
MTSVQPSSGHSSRELCHEIKRETQGGTCNVCIDNTTVTDPRGFSNVLITCVHASSYFAVFPANGVIGSSVVYIYATYTADPTRRYAGMYQIWLDTL